MTSPQNQPPPHWWGSAADHNYPQQQYPPPVDYYQQQPHLGPAPQQRNVSRTYKHRSPLWHAGHITVCVFTCGLWLPVYLYMWNKPETVTRHQ